MPTHSTFSAKLLYNPVAGQNRQRRLDLVRKVTSVLCAQGFAVQAEATYARGSAAQQAREAVGRGAAAVFACGGDGTVHDVLQGIAGTDAMLGVIPAGSANALAQELRIPGDAIRAAQSLSPERFCSLRTTAIYRTGRPPLYSLCMAGAGPDGLLMYRMLAVDRARAGRWRYYEQALRAFLSHRFVPFPVEVHCQDGTEIRQRVVAAMALRVGDLRGVFRGIARGASVQQSSMHVILVAPPARLTLPLWFFLSWLGLGQLHPGVTVHKADRLQSLETVPMQVDGEWTGNTAATITMDGPWQRVLTPP